MSAGPLVSGLHELCAKSAVQCAKLTGLPLVNAGMRLLHTSPGPPPRRHAVTEAPSPSLLTSPGLIRAPPSTRPPPPPPLPPPPRGSEGLAEPRSTLPLFPRYKHVAAYHRAVAAQAQAQAPPPHVSSSGMSRFAATVGAAAAVGGVGAAVQWPYCVQSFRHFSARPPSSSPPPVTVTSLGATPSRRQLSVQPEAAVYSGPSPRNPARVTLRTIRKKYELGEPLTMVTAYDYPSAVHVEASGIDICLVGDSVAMVVHGHDTTLPIRLDEMISHCQAVARGSRRAFLVGDLPFGCYETDARDAVRSAVRMLKEGGMDAVKLEGGSPARVEAARAIVEAGVAVMGHVGLTPQSVSVIGGFRPQAQLAEEALRVLDQAQALQRAGCFALVLECIPGPIAAAITRSLTIPTIGIGAGGECSGQVLVYHDLLGMMSHPHHAKVTPKFCKQYAKVGDIIGAALLRYRQEVEDGTFPGPRYSPYGISEREVDLLAEALRNRGLDKAAVAALEEVQKAALAKAAATAVTAAASAAPGSGATNPDPVAEGVAGAAGGCEPKRSVAGDDMATR